MKKLGNQGFALVTSLMITMISLVIIMGVMMSVTQGTRTTASKRIYKNAIEASYGGAEVIAYEIIPSLSADTIATVSGRMADLISRFGAGSLNFNVSDACVTAKLRKDSSGTNWTTPCGAASLTTLDPQLFSDLRYTLGGVGGNRFQVQSAIVDSSPGVDYPADRLGNTGGVVSKGSGFKPSLAHFVYRIEVSATSNANSTERSLVSVVYEY